MSKLNIWKWRSTKIILALALLLAVFCVAQMSRRGREYVYEGGTCFTQGTAVAGQPVYEGISLPPGCYRVALEYSSSEDLRSLCEAGDGTVFPGGLLTNGEVFYSGRSETRFQMWLFERADALRILVNYDGVGSLETGNLRIYDTGLLWTMYLVILLAATLLALAVQLLRACDRAYGISRENKAVLFWLSVIILLATVPYMTGGVPSGGDTGYHMHRIDGIKDGILAGYFPVRLEPEWVHGHGYANGIFYCGTLLLFPALLRIAGFPVTLAYNCYVAGVNIATAVIAYCSFARVFRDKYIGIASSALYTLSAFRLHQVLIGNVGEYSAMMFLPLLLYGYWRLFTQDRRLKEYRTCWLPLAFGYAGLFQTHVLSCEITALLTLVLLLVQIKQVFRRETFRELCKGAAGALALSAWFLVPFLDYTLREDMHFKHVWGRTIQEAGLSPALLLTWVGLGMALGLLCFLALWLSGRLGDREENVWKLGRLSLLLGICLMLMSLRLFPWDRIQQTVSWAAPLISSLQFPRRFLGWGSALLTALCGCCLYYFKTGKKHLLWNAGLMTVAVSVILSGVYYTNGVDRDMSRTYLYNIQGMGYGYISGAEYLVQGTEHESLLYRGPVSGGAVTVTDYEKGALRAQFTCCNADRQEGYVELPLLHYYGYRAYGEDGELTVRKGENNLVRVVIPPGCHTAVRVRFVSPWYWRVAEGVSYLTAAAILLMCIRKRRIKRSERGKHERIPAKA